MLEHICRYADGQTASVNRRQRWRRTVQPFTMLAVQDERARKLAGLWVDIVSDGEAIVLDDMT